MDVIGGVTDRLGEKPRRFAVAIAGFAVVWQAFSILFPLGVASPADTLRWVVELVTRDRGVLVATVSISLFRIVVGFLLALTTGTVLGVLMGMSQRGEDYFYVLVLIGMMVPSLSWAMMSLVVFGLGETAIVIAITVTTTPFIAVSIWEGVKDIDDRLLEVAHVFHLGRWATVRHVILPQIAPFIFSASRYGFGLAWKIAVVVELLGANSGVGFKLNEAFNFASLQGVFGWTLIVVVVMVVIEYGIIRAIEGVVLDWRTPSGGGSRWQ